MISCYNCGIETANPKFCSRSCASITNNTSKPKRKAKMTSCISCGRTTVRRRRLCDECTVPDMSLQEAMYTKHGPASASALVRSRARSVARDLERVCANCGYTKHVEVCHIKPISSFSLDTKLSVINDMSNLVLLCPNCHWEFDHPSKE